MDIRINDKVKRFASCYIVNVNIDDNFVIFEDSQRKLYYLSKNDTDAYK